MGQTERVLNALQKAAERSEETEKYLSEVVKAQNVSGVLVMTLLQTLVEKGVVTKEEVDRRFELNKTIALSEDGDCKIALSKLLETPENK